MQAYYRMYVFLREKNLKMAPRPPLVTVEPCLVTQSNLRDAESTAIVFRSRDEENLSREQDLGCFASKAWPDISPQPSISLDCSTTSAPASKDACARQSLVRTHLSVSQPMSTNQHRDRHTQMMKKNLHQVKLIKILLVTITAFLCCWAPYSIDGMIVTLGYRESRPYLVERLFTYLAFSNS